MATLGANYLTLADWAKRVDPDGSTADIVESLNETNEILDDMLVTEGNLPTGHRTTIRTGLSSGVWRKLNYGVQPSKSRTAQVDDTCGLYEQRSEIDEKLAKLNGNQASFLMSEEAPFVESMSQVMADGFFYNDTDTDPEKFLGLAPRFPSLATSNVINAGGGGSDLTSVWLIVWGPQTVFGIFPKGSAAGLQRNYKGLEAVKDAQSPSGTYYAHVSQYIWELGLCVRDWRYIVRICNIETALGASANILDPDLMVEAIGLLPSMRTLGGRAAFYLHKRIWTQLCKQAMNKSNAALSFDEVFGRKVLTFWGIPLRQVDQLLLTEDALV